MLKLPVGLKNTLLMVDIIIITHNSSEVLTPCLKSIKLYEPQSRLIIIDNASIDQTIKLIKKLVSSDHLILIKNKSNQGFAKAVNQGLIISNNNVLLLNPDTILTMPIIKKLTKFLNNKIAAVSPLAACGNFPTITNIILDRLPFIKSFSTHSHYIRNPKFYQQIQYPDWATGACLLLNQNVIKKIGMFDQAYFMYLEEVDWQYRASIKGFKTCFIPGLTVIHKNEGSSPSKKSNKAKYMRQGFQIYFKKYNRSIDLYLFKILLKFEQLFK